MALRSTVAPNRLCVRRDPRPALRQNPRGCCNVVDDNNDVDVVSIELGRAADDASRSRGGAVASRGALAGGLRGRRVAEHGEHGGPGEAADPGVGSALGGPRARGVARRRCARLSVVSRALYFSAETRRPCDRLEAYVAAHAAARPDYDATWRRYRSERGDDATDGRVPAASLPRALSRHVLVRAGRRPRRRRRRSGIATT